MKLIGKVVLVSIFTCVLCASGQTSGYHIVDKIHLGGDGGWDYLSADPVSGLLFISRSSHVQVMEMKSGKLRGDILHTNGVHGIAIAHEFGKGYISAGHDDAVVIFSLKDLSAIRSLKTGGSNPDCIIYDSASGKIFAFNGHSNSATVIDPAVDSVVSIIPLSGKPEFAQADGNGHVFVNLEDKSAVAGIDSRTYKQFTEWSTAPGDGPTGLAIDRGHHLLFSVTDNKKMIVSDYTAGKIVAEVPIGQGPDAAGFDPGTGLIFSSNGKDGTVTIVHEDSPGMFRPVDVVATAHGAKTMTLDPVTHTLYLSSAAYERPAGSADASASKGKIIPDSFTVLVVGR